MHKRIILTAAALTMFFSVCMTGCALSAEDNISLSDNSSVSHDADLFAMDTYMTMRAYGDNAEEALKDASDRIYELENELSVTVEGSDLWRINDSGGDPVEVCDDTAKLINAAKEYSKDTDGALDITIYPVLKEWGFTTGEYHIPSQQKLSELLDRVDCTKLSLSGNTVTVPDDMQIDLGALAKGYTGDQVMEELSSRGVRSAIISLGGNVQALGSKPDGSDWSVSVLDPFSSDRDMCVVKVSDKAVITSGNYERYFTGDDGKNYWHIIDPSDGFPADNGIVSATIIGKSGLMCDALSTALFAAGTEKAVEYWKTHGGFDMILVTDDKQIMYTEGIADSFRNISEMSAEVITVD